MSNAPSPYGKEFTLRLPLENLECWNCTDGTTGSIPAGTVIEVCCENDSFNTTIQVREGPALECIDRFLNITEKKRPGLMGLRLNHRPDGMPPQQPIGFRFIADNQRLGDAIGVPMPKTFDLVGHIMAYEEHPTRDAAKELFDHLQETGIGRKLQGHYSSKMS